MDLPFVQRFSPAGEINEAVVVAHEAVSRQAKHPQRHQGFKRYYYLNNADPTISLVSIARPLEPWTSPVMATVGNQQVIGEFEGNKIYTGLSGTKITFRSIEWLQAPAEKTYTTASSLFQDLELPLLEVEVVVHASSLSHPAVRSLLTEYQCPHSQLSSYLVSVLVRGIESCQQLTPSEVYPLLSPSEQTRLAQAQRTGVIGWRLSLSNGKQLFYIQALHSPWSFLCVANQ